jgi:acyl carrier protein phosphodiesterase
MSTKLSALKAVAGAVAHRTNARLNAYPSLKRWLIQVARRAGLYNWLGKMRRRLQAANAPQVSTASFPVDFAQLTPHARHIYSEMAAAIVSRKNQKKNANSH